jgi:transcriptional/translational regulatory protein YebC/TACO1
LAGKNFDELELELIDAGAYDILREKEGVTIYAKPGDLAKVNAFLDGKNIMADSAQIEMVARETQNVSEDDKRKVQEFIDALDDHEDVDDYYTNIDI